MMQKESYLYNYNNDELTIEFPIIDNHVVQFMREKQLSVFKNKKREVIKLNIKDFTKFDISVLHDFYISSEGREYLFSVLKQLDDFMLVKPLGTYNFV